jgi:hypothetical protein
MPDGGQNFKPKSDKFHSDESFAKRCFCQCREGRGLSRTAEGRNVLRIERWNRGSWDEETGKMGK